MSVPPCETDSLAARSSLAALAAGKPPGRGEEQGFFFGRAAQLERIQRDLELVKLGSSAMRFIVGDHGAGKTAFLHELARRARQARFVTMHVDIARERLLWGGEDEALKLLEQATLNMRTLGSGSRCAMEALVGSLLDPEDGAEAHEPRGRYAGQHEKIKRLGDLPRGHDFAHVLGIYADALWSGNDTLEMSARQWLFGQYRRDIEARRQLGVAAIAKADVWTLIKLWARVAQLAGRPGVVLVIDELRVLMNLPPITRENNYAQLFNIFNEIMQGEAKGLHILVGATPTVMSSNYRALCSEAGLGSCLNNGKAIGTGAGLVDAVAIPLADLEEEAMAAMLLAVRDLFGTAYPDARLMPAEDVPRFIEQSRDRLGGQRYPLPRDLIRRFLDLHNQLAANPVLQWTDVMRGDVRGIESFASMASASGEYADHMM